MGVYQPFLGLVNTHRASLEWLCYYGHNYRTNVFELFFIQQLFSQF